MGTNKKVAARQQGGRFEEAGQAVFHERDRIRR